MKRRRTFKRRSSRARRKGRKVARISTVKRMINSREETKWRSISNGDLGVGLNLSYDTAVDKFLIMNSLIKGTARNQRLGNQVRASSLEHWLTVTPSAKLFSRFRLVFFWDTQPTGGIPLVAGASSTGFYADTGAADTTTCMTPLNPNTVGKRYRIISDRIHTVGVEGGATDVAQERIIRTFLRLKGKRVSFNDSDTADSTQFTKNILYCHVICDETSANTPVGYMRSVLKFRDA